MSEELKQQSEDLKKQFETHIATDKMLLAIAILHSVYKHDLFNKIHIIQTEIRDTLIDLAIFEKLAYETKYRYIINTINNLADINFLDLKKWTHNGKSPEIKLNITNTEYIEFLESFIKTFHNLLSGYSQFQPFLNKNDSIYKLLDILMTNNPENSNTNSDFPTRTITQKPAWLYFKKRPSAIQSFSLSMENQTNIHSPTAIENTNKKSKTDANISPSTQYYNFHNEQQSISNSHKESMIHNTDINNSNN